MASPFRSRASRKIAAASWYAVAASSTHPVSRSETETVQRHGLSVLVASLPEDRGRILIRGDRLVQPARPRSAIPRLFSAPPSRFRPPVCCNPPGPGRAARRPAGPGARPLLEDDLAAGDAIAALRRYSLVSPAADRSVSAHRLVQAVTADRYPCRSAWARSAATTHPSPARFPRRTCKRCPSGSANSPGTRHRDPELRAPAAWRPPSGNGPSLGPVARARAPAQPAVEAVQNARPVS